VAEKEVDKGLMHSFFGEELCHGCKGMLVVAFIAPTQKDVGSFASAFSRFQKEADADADKLIGGAQLLMKAPKSRAGSSFTNAPGAKRGAKKKRK
jgi:isochorismate hydrolase